MPSSPAPPRICCMRLRSGLRSHRLMAIGAHARDDIGSGVIQVEQNITGIAMLGIRPEIDVKALKVTCAQEAQHASPCQLARIPETFSWTGPARGAIAERVVGKIVVGPVAAPDTSAVGHASLSDAYHTRFALPRFSFWRPSPRDHQARRETYLSALGGALAHSRSLCPTRLEHR
jgi:hypothetical protein